MHKDGRRADSKTMTDRFSRARTAAPPRPRQHASVSSWAAGQPGEAGDTPERVQYVTVSGPIGLHLRSAAMLVQRISGFDSEIRLRCNGREANARSLLSVLMLQAGPGASVALAARGRDAEAALAAMASLFDDNFGEAVDGTLSIASVTV